MLVREGLEQTATGALRRMASAHGLSVDDATTRGELVDRLSDRLADTTYLTEQLAALSDGERALLVEARATGGELRGLLIERDHPAEADGLVDRGLLFRVFAAAGPRRGEVFAAPDEVLGLLPAPTAAEPPAPANAPPERRATDPAFSLFCLASAIERHGADLEREVRAWSVEPGGWQWDARWSFLRQIAISAGLLVHQPDGAIVAGPSLARALNDPPALAERLWRAYLRDRSWSDLGQALAREDAADLVDGGTLREALVDAFDSVVQSEWLSVGSISDWLQRTHPTLVREHLSPRGLLALDGLDWSELELPLLRYLLLGPLYWLGRTFASPDGVLVARRSVSGVQPEACTWQQHDLLAPARVELGTLLEAERYLLLRERGRLSRYELVQAHVATALGSGGSIADCNRLLLRLTQAPLPPLIAERLVDWQERLGAVLVRPAVVLEARSADVLDAALADERVRGFVHARLSPLLAEVPAADALELAAALRQAGHLPRVDAALRLSADPRRAYASLVDQQVLEWLLVCLLAFRDARPEQLAELEGSTSLLERLEHQFPPERLRELRARAARLAGDVRTSPRPTPRRRRRKRSG